MTKTQINKQDVYATLQNFLLTPMAMSDEWLTKVQLLTDTVSEQKIQTFFDEGHDKWYRASIDDLQYSAESKIGILPVDGLMTAKYDPFLDWLYGITAYETLIDDMETMIEAGAKTVVFHVDSGGGEAYTMLESAAELRKMAEEAGVKLVTYNDGIAASAAYGISSIADEFISNPDAEAGSIGVVVSLLDTSEYMKKIGLKREFITAGEGKVPYNEDGSFRQEFKDDLKAKVEALYERFVQHEATHRELSTETIKSYGAKVYSATDALEKGLIDGIMTRMEFSEYLAELSDKGEKKNNMAFFKKDKADVGAEGSEDLGTLQAALETAKTEYEAKVAELTQTNEKLQADLEVALKELAAAAEEKKNAKLEARKAKLAAVVGDVKAASLATSLASLSDEQFQETLTIMGGVVEAKEEEIGDSGSEVETESSHTPSEAKEAGMTEFLTKQYKNKQGK